MKSRNIFYGFLVACLLWGCTQSDDGNTAAPTLNYGQELKATLNTPGSSHAPEVNWNGDVGQFGLKNKVNGFAIDSQTGVISWDKDLTLGEHSLEVIAFNNAGTSTLTLTIENPLAGKFRGELLSAILEDYTDSILEIDFKEDGSLIGFDRYKNPEGDTVGPFEFFGSFTVNKNEVRGDILYEEGEEPTPFDGLIDQSGQKVIFSGRVSYPDIVCEWETCVIATFELEIVQN